MTNCIGISEELRSKLTKLVNLEEDILKFFESPFNTGMYQIVDMLEFHWLMVRDDDAKEYDRISTWLVYSRREITKELIVDDLDIVKGGVITFGGQHEWKAGGAIMLLVSDGGWEEERLLVFADETRCTDQALIEFYKNY